MGDGRRKSSESISEREVKPLSIKQNMLWNLFVRYLPSLLTLSLFWLFAWGGYEAEEPFARNVRVQYLRAFAIYRMYTYQVPM
ncbi:MAG: hypothetical protein ACLU6V_05475 [Lancefieldella rimae]